MALAHIDVTLLSFLWHFSALILLSYNPSCCLAWSYIVSFPLILLRTSATCYSFLLHCATLCCVLVRVCSSLTVSRCAAQNYSHAAYITIPAWREEREHRRCRPTPRANCYDSLPTYLWAESLRLSHCTLILRARETQPTTWWHRRG